MQPIRDDLPTMPFVPGAPPPQAGGSPTVIDRIYDAAGLSGLRDGEEVGPYRIEELIGEGGFGAVYRAEQLEPVRRRVALKVIKPGMDSYEVLTRFEAERQALAMIDHPNVARVFDAGVSKTGRPYFAMEYVPGRNITRYCDEENLTIRQRLELFIDICQAVQHAHQKGIIHRDLKPGNILITIIDGSPVPKVIDFGIAKATTQSLTDEPLHTSAGRLMGTPEYMSPEQAAAAGTTGADIDTRTDIYSLGVILYELLTGMLPFDSDTLRASGFAGVIRTLSDVTPPKPSEAGKARRRAERIAGRTAPITNASPNTNASPTASPAGRDATVTFDGAHNARGESNSLAAASHPTHIHEPAARELRGDLDWITMKAIEKDRSQRYETASALAMDIRRHLNNEPVLAGSPSAIYRFGKFARRNRAVIIGGSAVLIAVIAGLVAATIGFLTASKERDLAQESKSAAEESAASAKRESARAKLAQADALKQKSLAETARADAEAQKDIALQGEKNLEQLTYRLRFASAESAMQRWDFRHAKKELLACDPRLRQWEWYALASRLDESVGTLYRPGENPGVAVYSPDGRFILTGAYTLTLWDAKTLAPVQTFGQGAGETARSGFRSLAFSPDGKLIAAARIAEQDVDIFDIALGKRIRRVNAYRDAAHLSPAIRESRAQGDVAFSADSKRLLVSGWVVRTFDVATGAALVQFECPSFCRAAAWAKGDSIIAAAGNDSVLHLWNASTGAVVREVPLAGAAWGLAFSSDGKFAAVGLQFKPVVQVLSTDDWQFRTALLGEGDDSARVAFSPDSKMVASVSTRGVVNVWTTDEWRLARSFAWQHGAGDLAFSPDSKSIITTGAAVKRWDVSSLTRREAGPASMGNIAYAHASADMQHIIAEDAKGSVCILDCSGPAPRAIPLTAAATDKLAYVWYVDISGNGAAAMTLTTTGGMTIWDAVSGSIIRDFPARIPPFVGGALSFDGKVAAVIGKDGQLLVYDAREGIELWRGNVPANNLTPAAFSPSGKYLAVQCATSVELFEVATRKAATFEIKSGTLRGSCICFSPNEDRFAAYWENGSAACWTIATRDQAWREVGDRSSTSIYCASFTRDAQRILVCAHYFGTGEAHFSDANTGRMLMQLPLAAQSSVVTGMMIPAGDEDAARLLYASQVTQDVSTQGGHAFAERSALREQARNLFNQRLRAMTGEPVADTGKLTLFNDIQKASPRAKAYESIMTDPAVSALMRSAVTEYLMEGDE